MKNTGKTGLTFTHPNFVGNTGQINPVSLAKLANAKPPTLRAILKISAASN